MFSSNLKRSVATLGVVAGLLAAAVPASAQVMPGTMGVTTPQVGSEGVKASVPPSLIDYQGGVLSFHTGKAPTNAGTQVGSEGVKATDTRFTVDPQDGATRGTQVVSEGVKAPTGAEPRSAWHQSVVEGQLNTLGGDDSLSVVADAGAGNDTLRADSNEVAVEGLGVVTNNNDPDTMGLALREPATITLCHEGFC